jgi:hypothetical protein
MNHLSFVGLVSLSTFAGSYTLADIPKGRGQSTCETRPESCQWGTLKVGSKSLGTSDQVTATQSSPSHTLKKPNLKKTIRPTQYTLKSYFPGDLPEYHADVTKRTASADGFVIVADKPPGAVLQGLRPGDILVASLEQSIKASASVPTPIRARVESGTFRKSIVLGTATLDRELKRILLTFDRLRLESSEISYALKATGLAPNGQVGLEGDHHTQEGTYFAGEILAATAAGYADATTQRTQNVMSGYQIEPSVQNATKQGAVTALSKTADRLAERSRNAPEYTEIEAGREIQIIIQEVPTEVSGQ